MSGQGNSGGNPRFSLARWSERKRAAARGERAHDAPGAAEPAPAPPMEASPVAPSSTMPEGGGATARAVDTGAQPLPPVASLTFDSDFTAFMQGGVDADVKRAALRKLLRDPRFNVMDGLDVYIDDYSQPDPIPPEMLARLAHSVATLNPQGPGLEMPASEHVTRGGGNVQAPVDGEAGRTAAPGVDADAAADPAIVAATIDATARASPASTAIAPGAVRAPGGDGDAPLPPRSEDRR